MRTTGEVDKGSGQSARTLALLTYEASATTLVDDRLESYTVEGPRRRLGCS